MLDELPQTTQHAQTEVSIRQVAGWRCSQSPCYSSISPTCHDPSQAVHRSRPWAGQTSAGPSEKDDWWGFYGFEDWLNHGKLVVEPIPPIYVRPWQVWVGRWPSSKNGWFSKARCFSTPAITSEVLPIKRPPKKTGVPFFWGIHVYYGSHVCIYAIMYILIYIYIYTMNSY